MRRLSVVDSSRVPPRVDSRVTQPEDGCLTRRAILATLAAAALTACSSTTITVPATQDSGPDTDGGDDGGADAGPTCPAAAGSAGSVTSFPQGTWKAVGAYIVGHDASGLFAFSTTCTHRGCTIGAPSIDGSTTCPCHGAMFDGTGAVTRGPASSPLPHFALTVCDGSVFVDPTMTVAASTRTPPA